MKIRVKRRLTQIKEVSVKIRETWKVCSCNLEHRQHKHIFLIVLKLYVRKNGAIRYKCINKKHTKVP